MEDPRQKRPQELMDSFVDLETKYGVQIEDTIRSLFTEDITQEVKHYINPEDFVDPEKFNKFFAGGLLALYKLYASLIDNGQIFTVLDFLHILTQYVFNMNITVARKEAVEEYKAELAAQETEEITEPETPETAEVSE